MNRRDFFRRSAVVAGACVVAPIVAAEILSSAVGDISEEADHVIHVRSPSQMQALEFWRLGRDL